MNFTAQATRLWRSLSLRAAILAVLLITLPLVLYDLFRLADVHRQDLLRAAIQAQSLVVGRALQERLAATGDLPLYRLSELLARYQTEGTSLRLFLRPSSPAGSGFLVVAAAPPLAPSDMEAAKNRLDQAGVLASLPSSCLSEAPIALRLDRSDGATELISAIVATRTPQGCFALAISRSLNTEAEHQLGRPYWQTPEVRTAFLLYLAFVALVAAILFDVGRALRRFVRLAGAIAGRRETGRFAAATDVPELIPAARAFDSMVDSLRAAAAELRDAAEETAHALKAPIGTLRQAVEPLRRRVPADDERGHRALTAADGALDRLEELIQTARRLDQATAARLDPRIAPLDLADWIRLAAARHAATAAGRRILIETDALPSLSVLADRELVVEALGQVIENALSFSPEGARVRIAAAASGAKVTVTVQDQGPGAPEDMLPLLFERHLSHRPDAAPGQHYGLGLWIAKRNLEACGGTIMAANQPSGGLAVSLTLARA